MIAAAQTYLSYYLLREIQSRGLNFKAQARDTNPLLKWGLNSAQIVPANPNQAKELYGSMTGMEVLISSLGLYSELNYQVNINLLHEAKRAGLKKLILVLPLACKARLAKQCDKLRHIAKTSQIDFQVIETNPLFPSLDGLLIEAESGKLSLYGKGNYRINPIHGEDLAAFILEHLSTEQTQLQVGGPEILTQNEIGQLALDAHYHAAKLVHYPAWMLEIRLGLRKLFSQNWSYPEWCQSIRCLKADQIAPRYGIQRLKVSFHQSAQAINFSHT